MQCTHLAVLDIAELVGEVSGPCDELSRSEQPLVDAQRRRTYETLSRIFQERNLSQHVYQ